MPAFTTFASPEHGFKIDVPVGWKLTVKRERSGAGFFARLVDAFSEQSVFIAAVPDGTGQFARMGVEVRGVSEQASRRQRVEYQGETRTLVAGLPAVEANYTLAGTCFRKFAVVSGQHEYLLNFGHDGSLSDDLIDVIVDSFQFVDR